jgi:hypothetical protein
VEILLILNHFKSVTNDKKVKGILVILVCCILFCDTCGDVTGERAAGGSNKMEGNQHRTSLEDGFLLGRNV